MNLVQWRKGAVGEFALVQPTSLVGAQAQRVLYAEYAQERGPPQWRHLSMPSSIKMLRNSAPEIHSLSQVDDVRAYVGEHIAARRFWKGRRRGIVKGLSPRDRRGIAGEPDRVVQIHL